MKKYAIWCLLVAELPKLFHLIGNRGREHDGNVRFLTASRNVAVSRMHNENICNLALTCGRIDKIPSSYRKAESGNAIVTSDLNFDRK